MNFKNKVVYEIYPKSFQDSDRDGVGDLRGILRRLPYLEKLGVDLLWITPFFPSHQYDNGYDVDDYCNVDPAFGTMEDLRELIEEAKKRGIGIMLDMVFNHTSTYHPWFQKALEEEEARKFYYFVEDRKPPTNWESKFGGSAWKKIPGRSLYYLHLYHEKQADLNWNYPPVRRELQKILTFWKDFGVAGFRFDVINVIGKSDPPLEEDQSSGKKFYTDTPKVRPFIEEMVRKAELSEVVTVGELSSTTPKACRAYTREGKGLNMAFNFHHLKLDYKDGDKWTLGSFEPEELFDLLTYWQEELAEEGWSAWFWNNHDQPRAVSRFAPAGKEEPMARLLAVLLFTLRGTPFLYQGEEFGMRNGEFQSIEDFRDVESKNFYEILRKTRGEQEALHVLRARSRDNSRIPMVWDSSPYGGFSEHAPWIGGTSSEKESVSAEQALKDPNSLFYFYQKLIRLRKREEALVDGPFTRLTAPKNVFHFLRGDRDGFEIWVNWSDQDLKIPCDPSQEVLSSEYENGILKPFGALITRRNGERL